MTEWYNELTKSQPPASPAKPAQPEFLPEFWDMVPNPVDYAPAGPAGLIALLTGREQPDPIMGRKDQWQLPGSKVQALMNAGTLTQDDQQLLDIIQKEIPDATFEAGGDNRLIVNIQGKRAYLNAPGFSPQDLVRGTTATTAAALAATPAGMATRGLPLLARGAAVGLGSGAGTAAQDVGAHLLGAEKIVDPGRVALSTAAGFAGETVLQPAIQAGYRFIVSRGGRLYDRAAGRLTEAGRNLLQRLGANADDISDDLARSFSQQAQSAARPGEALRYAEAQSLPVPVQPTRGQITLSPRQQMFEEGLSKGTFGESASNIMRNAEQAQQAALRANIPAIQQRMGGIVAEPGAGAAAAQQALVGQRGALESTVNAAYSAARAAGGSAGIGINQVDDLGAAMSRDLAMNYTQGVAPKADAVLRDFAKLSDAARGGFMRGQEAAGDASVMVRSLFDWRARATATLRGTNDATEASAIRSMIGQFDDWIGNNVDAALFSGNPEAANLWRGAIAARRELGARFQGEDLIDALTRREPRSGEMMLKVAPEDAANYIFGASDTGWISKSNLTRDLMRIRSALGENSEAWNALRQEAFMRIARTGEGAYQGGTRLFSGVNFDKAWTSALQKNAPLVNVLFTPQERSLISQFGRVAARLTNPVKGGSNPSGTANALANIMQNMTGSLGSILSRYLGRMTMLSGPIRAAQAVAATQAAPAVGAIAPGIGGTMGNIGAQIWQRAGGQNQ